MKKYLILIFLFLFFTNISSAGIIKASNIGKFNKIFDVRLQPNEFRITATNFGKKNNNKSFVIMLKFKGEKISTGDIFKAEKYLDGEGNSADVVYIKQWTTTNHITYMEQYSSFNNNGFVKITKAGKYYVEGTFKLILSTIEYPNASPKKTITTKGYFKVNY